MIECTTRWPRACRRISGPLISLEPRPRNASETSLSNAIQERRLRMKIRSFCACVLLALAAAATVTANSATAQDKALSAREVIARIQAHVGIPWQQETVDTFKAGNPDAQVKGIAVTMMATLDVLQRAAAVGQNLIITHEPTFYNHLDKPGELEQKED